MNSKCQFSYSDFPRIELYDKTLNKQFVLSEISSFGIHTVYDIKGIYSLTHNQQLSINN